MAVPFLLEWFSRDRIPHINVTAIGKFLVAARPPGVLKGVPAPESISQAGSGPVPGSLEALVRGLATGTATFERSCSFCARER
jgi:hypothetical protein